MNGDEPGVMLHSAGLLSKWGFGDGGTPESFLDYCDERGVQYPEWPLEQIVREYLLPVLDQHVEIAIIPTHHNPVRAVTVDGRNVEDEWYASGEERTRLTPETVVVPCRAILEMTSEEATPGASAASS